jgi:bifunctional DNA-binding transcriptional regulator/antitoxin component of YhaV-PrlF toxin-antitoxin module
MPSYKATVTSKDQVTIPVAVRYALALVDVFTVEEGFVTLRSAHRPTLEELLAGFDPTKHRHKPEERIWDDSPRGRESL